MTPPLFHIHLPSGLDSAILDLLSDHIGRARAIPRAELCAALRHFRIHERQLRQQIRLLRRAGHLIGSAAGEHGGYYLIVTPEEFEDFLCSEYQAKINDMRQTVKAMTACGACSAADSEWGPGSIQPTLL